ncbi:site-specific integrase [uncultured Thiodictyon sp.]|jgi:integrase|uniref:tyrosine-type recombinase/integrase n=1 Tax=uncultured Thiodictyon sp. TaxID=1846217 RepID=UPI0025D592E0|nr:site-specific integrase [uncultured Thiodictyon sp.]
MATITERTDASGATSYRVEVRLKGYPAQRATFTRKTDAKKWAQGTESAIREGRHFGTVEAKRHTLADLIDRYTRDVLPTKKTATQAPQVQQLGWWKDQIGSKTLADVTPALLAEYRDTLSREPIPCTAKDPAQAGPARYRTPATVNRYLAALSHAFTVAVKEWAWVEFNPLLKVTKPKEPRGRVRFLADDERERLLSACRESRNRDLYPAVILALSTGARQQEVMGLRWPQVDLTRRVATLDDTKNGERRVLPLAGPALELLRERSKVRRLDTDLVFPGHTRPAKPVDLRTPFETALKVAEIQDFHWHDLRHTAASYLAMNGASLAEIAEVLGHKTLSMVKRYAHLSEAHTASVVERMNARYFGEGGK